MGDIYSLGIKQTLNKHEDISFVVFFYKKEIDRQLISYLESKICNDLTQDIKASPIANSFIHVLREISSSLN